MKNRPPVFGLIVVGLVTLVTIVAVLVGIVAGFKSFNRAQKRADANNQVKVTSIYVKRTQQEARRITARNAIVEAQAQQRVIEAHGIREAQDLIAATLTPLYVQHEAIQAQLKSPSEKVYIPVGSQGVPLVADISGTKAVK